MIVPPLWQALLWPALAGGVGWGIRGQYGHGTGAMIAGLLVSLTLAMLFCRRGSPLAVARAVAIGTVAMGFGGVMTYGQTIGLTQNPTLIGNGHALGWGLFGLAIKGAIWIGLFGVFLGMGLGGVRYRPVELGGCLLGLIGLMLLGQFLLNQPFDPVHRQLPAIYFSADWRWEPLAELKPRRELWGGLLFALTGAVLYAGVYRRDRLARQLAGWGALGGGLGFSLGQCVQAFHAWNQSWFQHGFLGRIDPLINWWNAMEVTFGAIFAAVLGLGLWLNRKRVAALDEPADIRLPFSVELVLLAVHIVLLGLWQFGSIPALDAVGDLALPMALIPMIAVAGGRHWPYWMILPVTAFPIAGKTLLAATGSDLSTSDVMTWIGCVVAPLVVTAAAAMRWAGSVGSTRPGDGSVFAARTLILSTWLYLALNQVIFGVPWPWSAWNHRATSAFVFLAGAIGLTLAASRRARIAAGGAVERRGGTQDGCINIKN